MFVGIYPKLLIYTLLAALLVSGTWKLTSLAYEAEINDMRKDKAKAQLVAKEAQVREIQRAREVDLLYLTHAGNISMITALRNEKREATVHIVKQKVIEYVKGNEPKCDLTPTWVYIHDGAVVSHRMSKDTDPTSRVINPSGGTQNYPRLPPVGVRDPWSRTMAETPGVSDDVALEVVTDNYAICQKNSDNLTSLQEWAKGLPAVLAAKQ